MNGVMKLPAFGGKFYVIAGGPYMRRPANVSGRVFTVRLAKEIREDADVVIPIVDFSVPESDEALLKGLDAALSAMGRGEMVYAGCMGGRGRTGLFLACLAKLWGKAGPVEFVREVYFNHAVETEDQYAYVQALRFPLRMHFKVSWLKLRGHFGRTYGGRGDSLTSLMEIPIHLMHVLRRAA